MAIAQEEYIHIVSSNVGDTTAAERDLSGLVFTNTENLTAGTEGKDEWEGWTTSSPSMVTLSFTTSDAVAKAFGSLSREAAFASDYFGYISPSGTTPRKLSFCRVPASWGEGWYPADIVAKIDEQDTNFGSFSFLQSDTMTVAQTIEVIKKIKEKNYKYLFSLAVRKYVGNLEDVTVTNDKILEEVTAKSLIKYFTEGDAPALDFEACNGTFFIVSVREDEDESDVVQSEAAIDAFMPMSLFASTDYNAENSTKNFMFKTFDGVLPAVTTTAEKSAYDKLNINYVGLVQNYGRRRMFLQQGVNLDGEDAACYCNEIWLKSHISTELFDLLLTREKLEASDTGELLIYNTIAACAELAKTNGTIEVLKQLTDAQKRTIYRLTNSDTAWETIYQSGYWLDVEIRQVQVDNRTEYWAYYTLVYAKGDSVRKVEGRDFLV